MIETKETIHEVIIRLAMGWGKHPYDINCGDCEDFAYAVQEVIPEVDVYWGDDLLGDGFFTDAHEPEYHAFICYRGMYYDSEEPFGVENPAHLPCFQRNLRKNQYYNQYQYAPDPVFNFVVSSWDV